MKRCLAATILLLPALADAELVQVAADGFLVTHHYTIERPPDESWSVLLHPERWWPEDHTWSGNRSNLSLAPEAGACFCERWDGSSSEHGRVVMSLPGKLLRIRASLGPLQEMALTGVLTIVLKPQGTGTEAIVTYRVSGDSLHKLEDLATAVNQVTALQFGAFADFAGRSAH